MTERERLIHEAEAAMRAAGKIPEPHVLAILPDAQLRDIIWWHTR